MKQINNQEGMKKQDPTENPDDTGSRQPRSASSEGSDDGGNQIIGTPSQPAAVSNTTGGGGDGRRSSQPRLSVGGGGSSSGGGKGKGKGNVVITRSKVNENTTVLKGSSSSSSTGKRGREEEGTPKRKKGEIVNIPEGEIRCQVCKKPFNSWKAVFGHLRIHQRSWRGAFPPPGSIPEEQQPTSIGQVIQEEEEMVVFDEERTKREIDLNKSPSSSDQSSA
ncbi:hypothetical protein ACFE04_026702 [Oxalis oulophora]